MRISRTPCPTVFMGFQSSGSSPRWTSSSCQPASVRASSGQERTSALLLTNHSTGFMRLGVSERRSEEHTSELQSLMRSSYAVFCLKKKREKPLPKQDAKSAKRTDSERQHN